MLRTCQPSEGHSVAFENTNVDVNVQVFSTGVMFHRLTCSSRPRSPKHMHRPDIPMSLFVKQAPRNKCKGSPTMACFVCVYMYVCVGR